MSKSSDQWRTAFFILTIMSVLYFTGTLGGGHPHGREFFVTTFEVVGFIVGIIGYTWLSIRERNNGVKSDNSTISQSKSANPPENL